MSYEQDLLDAIEDAEIRVKLWKRIIFWVLVALAFGPAMMIVGDFLNIESVTIVGTILTIVFGVIGAIGGIILAVFLLDEGPSDSPWTDLRNARRKWLRYTMSEAEKAEKKNGTNS